MTVVATTQSEVKQASRWTGVRVGVQKLGTSLSNMVMPNIGAFIAWGLITALFIESGWLPGIFHGLQDPDGWVAKIGGWGNYDGRRHRRPDDHLPAADPDRFDRRPDDPRQPRGSGRGHRDHGCGGRRPDVPMFMGAMIMGPLGGYLMKKVDAVWDGKIRPGFEMLIDNFSAGILGVILAMFGFFGVGPIVSTFTRAAGNVVDFLVGHDLLPLTSIFIEPAKVLFLNNAINHGVLTPLGTTQAMETGKSILFLLETNPGPGLGILLGVHGVRPRGGTGLGAGRGDHPVLRRHPRDLLPVRPDEAQVDRGDNSRRHDRGVHQRPVRLGTARAGGSRIDHRDLRTDRQRQLPGGHAVRARRDRGVLRRRLAAAQDRSRRQTSRIWPRPRQRWKP